MSETTRDVELEALARETCRNVRGLEHLDDGTARRCHTCATILAALRRVQPLPDTCPHCREGVNSEDKGGTERCFHCDRCDYIGCMWTNAEKLDMLRRVQSEPSAEGPTRAQVKALRAVDSVHGVLAIDAWNAAIDSVLSLFAPPAADAEPEKETP